MSATLTLTPMRLVIGVQIAFIGLMGWYTRGGWARLPEETDKLLGFILVLAWWTFPIWGIAAAWRINLRQGQLAITLVVQLFLWLAMFLAMLPGIQ